MPDRMMPIMGSVLMNQIPFAMLEPHAEQARRNHGQSLHTLCERGGLNPAEALAILDGKSWDAYLHCEDNARVLINRVRKWRAALTKGGHHAE